MSLALEACFPSRQVMRLQAQVLLRQVRLAMQLPELAGPELAVLEPGEPGEPALVELELVELELVELELVGLGLAELELYRHARLSPEHRRSDKNPEQRIRADNPDSACRSSGRNHRSS